MATGITATIITLNEEKNIQRCLNSLKWCNEVVISDSFSSDKTKEIATRFKNVVFYEEKWHGYGKQKNIAASHAKNNWIFNIDSDEVCTPELATELQRIVSTNNPHNAYSVHRKNFIGNREIHFCGLGKEKIIRLYQKDKTAFSETNVHEGITEKAIENINQELLHYSFENYADFNKRQQKYAELAVLDMLEKGKKATLLDIYLRPVFTFVKIYFLRLGFLDGLTGLFIAKGYAQYTFLKYSALEKKQRK
ncbi:MAG: glycosyltransferase family 2 protein [Nitrospinae bacterium]|nr:glycosyltransferase family 2 protein [Nitrospinota bacterium]